MEGFHTLASLTLLQCWQSVVRCKKLEEVPFCQSVSRLSRGRAGFARIIDCLCVCVHGSGPGEIDWKQLAMVVGSEALKFEAEQDAACENGQPGADEASHIFASPRGDIDNQCQTCDAMPDMACPSSSLFNFD